MGQIDLPDSGTVYLDTNCFIYSIERIEPFDAILRPVWEAAQSGQFEIICSELVILEALVKPLQAGDEELVSLFQDMFRSREVRLIPADAVLWEKAANLRATFSGLKTPDALHAATALAHGRGIFVTNDPVFRRIADLSMILLSDLIPESQVD
jgi:predicted nucleic acid-binding protein